MSKKTPKRQAIEDMHLSSDQVKLLEESVEVFERIEEIIVDGRIIVRKIMRVIKVNKF